jgi:arsenate reductase (thioredoxin)
MMVVDAVKHLIIKYAMKKILVLCTGNSCRSQMAEAYLRHFAGSRAEIYSAGIEAHGVNPRAIAILKEDGIDISSHTSDLIQKYSGERFDWVITVCDNAKERCPIFSNAVKMIHHNFPDPAKAVGTPDEIMAQFRKVRDLVKVYSQDFVQQHL